MNTDLLYRGSQEVVTKDDLERKLASDEKLRVKFGIDPTGSKMHIGHASVIRKLKHFQDLGHQIVLIVGDFTGRIGDPSDKNSERPPLTKEDVQTNLKSYEQQLSKIFDTDQAEVRYNSEWFDEMGVDMFMELQGLFSVAQMVERDNFSKRFEANKRIGLQEFMYPLLQGYDSVAIEADVEIGGTDQLFNLGAGRTLQKHFDQEPQNIVTYELLLGPDGRKMSKSWGNCIWVDDSANEMYGKVMSVNDELMWDYFRIVTELPNDELKSIKKLLDDGTDLRGLKGRLAREITALYHGEAAAHAAEEAFLAQFQHGAMPKDIKDVTLDKNEWQITDLLVALGLVSSKSEARRVLGQGGVKVNSTTVSADSITVSTGDVVQVGKRKFKRVAL